MPFDSFRPNVGERSEASSMQREVSQAVWESDPEPCFEM